MKQIKYGIKEIANDAFYITQMEEEGLVAQGWIIYSGLAWGTAEPISNEEIVLSLLL